MLEALINKMVRRGESCEEVVKAAIALSREAYKRFSSLEALLDQAVGSAQLRKDHIDPLLEKERQIEAIEARVHRGGSVRVSDSGNLANLLKRHKNEYESMQNGFPWDCLNARTRDIVTSYIEERRNHLLLGDVDRVKSAYGEATRGLPIAC